MKKIFSLFTLIIFMFTLLSCDIFSFSKDNDIKSVEFVNNEFNITSMPTKLKIKVTYEDNKYVIVDVSDDMIDGNIDYTTAGEYNIKINYEKKSYDFVIIVNGFKTITLSSKDYIDGISQYSTGNFVTYRKESTSFQFYRATRNLSTTLASIFPKDTYVKVDSLPGAIYNKTPLDGLVSLNIKYKSDNGMKLLAGKSRSEMRTIDLPNQSLSKEYKVELNDDNFFSLETNGTTAVIESIDINYTGIDNGGIEEYLRCNEGKYRLNPVVYEGSLTPGVSYVDFPIDVTVNGDNYTVNQTKRYTYYTYDYVSKNPSVASLASYVEPLDVANYFIAFKTYPANYVTKKSYSAAYSLFFDNTRCVSDYSRTNGYATSVPYKEKNGKPHYYECDIALTSAYNASNRGVGRLVVFEYGFDEKGYDDSIVALFTDDHYASFSEYLNNGTWGDRFNAEFSRTSFIYASAKTLN